MMAGMSVAAARACEISGRAIEEITVVAVSKTFPAEAIRLAYDAGLRHFGENRVQEWEAKHPELNVRQAAVFGHRGELISKHVGRFHRVRPAITRANAIHHGKSRRIDHS